MNEWMIIYLSGKVFKRCWWFLSRF